MVGKRTLLALAAVLVHAGAIAAPCDGLRQELNQAVTDGADDGYLCKQARDALNAERRMARNDPRAEEIRKRRAALMVEYRALGEELRKMRYVEQDTIAPSRADALRTGARWYMPAEPCKYCGQTAPRYVANGRCRSCG